MVLIVIWVVVALLAAAGVLVLAAWVTREPAPASFLVDLQSGLQRARDERTLGILASARQDHADAADVELSSVDDLFRVGRPVEVDYLDAEALGANLVRTAGRARSVAVTRSAAVRSAAHARTAARVERRATQH